MDAAEIAAAAGALRRGGVVAYPTESVYGLGCDPADAGALARILRLKNRAPEKGLILVAAAAGQLRPYADETRFNRRCRELAARYWPGPVTIVLPARAGLPDLLTGGRDSIACRVSAHPVVRALCAAFGGALVSTSLNVSGEPPAGEYGQAAARFGGAVDLTVRGPTDGRNSPSVIVDGLTGRVLRGCLKDG